MTLIVGIAKEQNIYILGDTSLTYHSKRRANPFIDGCLKQYIVNDKLAFAFSGQQYDFEVVFPELITGLTADRITSTAISAYRDGRNFDLLVADAESLSLRFIKDGIVERSNFGFIGDADAFSAFETRYRTKTALNSPALSPDRAYIQFLLLPEPSHQQSTYPRMFDAMSEVILDANFPTVGGCIIPLCTDNGIFRYMSYSLVGSDILNTQDHVDRFAPISFGTASGGGFSIDFGDDHTYGGSKSGCWLYFLQGGFGIYFGANNTGFRKPKIMPATDPARWALQTKTEIGVAIKSSFLNIQHCCLAGEAELKSDNALLACFFYELRADSKELNHDNIVSDRFLAGYATALFNAGKQKQAISLLQEAILSHPTNNRGCRLQLSKMSPAFNG